MENILAGFTGSLLAGLATCIGAALVFFIRKVSDRFLDASLGFAAGVMLAATFFSLLLPAINGGGVFRAILGFALGACFIMLAERFTPHLHQVRGIKGKSRMNKLTLFILAITIHNFPEGMVVGVGFGAQSLTAAVPLAVGIGIQNIPEGLAVALPLVREGKSRWKAFLVALMTGLVEPVGGLIGASAVTLGTFLMPYGLAFAAGAMLFVISEEIIPETHSRGNDRQATLGLLLGFVLMMALDTLFA